MVATAAVREMARQLDSTGAVIGTDADGTVVYWNRAAEELYGWRSAEAMGRDILELTPSTMSKREGAEIMRALLAGKSWSGPFMCRDRNGQPLIVYVEDTPVIVDGHVVGIVGVSRLIGVG